MREHSEDPTAAPGTDLRGVIADWGGVFTNPIADAVNAWLAADLIDRDTYRTVMRGWVTQAYDGGGTSTSTTTSSWIDQLERGDCDPAEFERALAAQLVRTDGAQVPHAGLLSRMFAGSLIVPAMYDLMRAVRKAGFAPACCPTPGATAATRGRPSPSSSMPG